MEIKVIDNNGMGTNTYILSMDKEALIIDPVGDLNAIVNAIKDNELNIKAILLTHGHGDHIGLVPDVKQLTNAPIYIHAEDEEMINNASINLSTQFGKAIAFKGDGHYGSGEELTLGKESIEIIHTPGHTKGSVCIKIGDCLFTGDTVFKGSIGRTDFYGGDYEAILKSLNKIKTLDPKLKVYPGHGPSSTLDDEFKHNPYFQL